MTVHSSKPRLDDRQVLGTIRLALDAAATSRRRQLDELAVQPDDPVGVGLRDALERTLAEIGSAMERLDAGRFGDCQKCGAEVAVERLELRPWSPYCVACAGRAGM
jgi:RNA polymerase-binding transcription factor DksA